jgi:PIN domain nuclease of toxin-antitoxin system
MKYLLDTNAYYFVRLSPKMLPHAASQILTTGGHQLLISVITPWELAIKAGLGKLPVAHMLVDFEQRETLAGFTMTPITTLQAVSSGLLPYHHRDPFDRLLIAQALDMDIPIISSDRIFDLYGVSRIWN